MTNLTILPVANALLKESEYTISNLKLQKLLYLVYVLNLALDGSNPINEKVKACKFGPVLANVTTSLKKSEIESCRSPTRHLT